MNSAQTITSWRRCGQTGGLTAVGLILCLVFLMTLGGKAAVIVTIVHPGPVESIAPDGTVSGVTEANVGTKLTLVSRTGSDVDLKDNEGKVYRLAVAQTDYKEPFSRDTKIDTDWRFAREDDLGFTPPKQVGTDSNLSTADLAAPTVTLPGFDDSKWETVILPHTPRIEKFDAYLPWQGLCWYRKTIKVPTAWSGKKVSLEFEGTMQVADFWVNGQHRSTHYGGFLPYTLDLTNDAASGKPITLAVCIDNRDNGFVPPGKPLKNADFEYFGGMYRDVVLNVTDPLHITDAVAANKVAGGGIFVTFPMVDASSATVHVQTDVQNDYDTSKEASIVCSLMDDAGKTVATSTTPAASIANGTDSEIAQDIHVPAPKLWSPEQPNLYQLRVQLKNGADVVDEQSLQIGIRRYKFDLKTGFSINGRHLFLHGANRHQYYPWIGAALSDNEQYRDMVRLKTAGWNAVRLCHYPQSSQIMDACDKLGLVALVCSPGWQWYSADPAFVSRVEQADRDMVRWHRNHASAMLWEVTLNEDYPPLDKVKQWSAAIRQEMPGDQCFLSGDTKDYGDPKDIGFDAPYPGWNDMEHPNATEDLSRMRFVREYGAQAESDRTYGDGNMLTQVQIAQESLSLIARRACYSGCTRWSYMDYYRGGWDSLYASGAVTADRFPKFLFYFHKSQFPPELKTPLFECGPMVFIANYWKDNSPKDVEVFSNCDQVELFVNGVSLGKKGPDSNEDTIAVLHPPFTFPHVTYAPGTLKAVAYLKGKVAATAVVQTPGKATGIKLTTEDMGTPLTADGADVILVRAEIVDDNGTLVPDSKVPVTFSTSGPGTIVGDNPRAAGAGLSSTLLRAGLTSAKLRSPRRQTG